MMAPKAVADGHLRIFPHRTSTHYMGAGQAGPIQLKAQTVDQVTGCAQAGGVASIAVQRHHRAGACGKLDLGHAVKRALEALPTIGREAVIEHGGVIAA